MHANQNVEADADAEPMLASLSLSTPAEQLR